MVGDTAKLTIQGYALTQDVGQRNHIPGKDEKKIQLWVVQVNLLVGYFGAYTDVWQLRQSSFKAITFLPSLLADALAELKPVQSEAYHEWVQRECLNRCVAAGMLIEASFSSVPTNRPLYLTNMDPIFALPSSTRDWLMVEEEWNQPPEVLNFSEALDSINMGQKPERQVSNFGFLTIVAAVLYQICSFERATGARYVDLYTSFASRLDRSINVLLEMFNELSDDSDISYSRGGQ
ncbi:hypothetical protein SAPIO_CDS8732 [Scedosporium apiospermum]|uniref:Transcription factor domain-containing protein n=1 Tax=Pseudallescheria apiosperma TaxID=563466 RepID=A0A084FYU4_PSEDA|nr:uncharacterized protein SAPIO_CDS8732 [Scedosporium apiospermum]KEZ40256.1 hypothetical protein SAPIO_CDS8732 [Scedosporium apiospermum]